MNMIAVKGFNVRRNGSIISEMRLVWIPGRRPVIVPVRIPRKRGIRSWSILFYLR